MRVSSKPLRRRLGAGEQLELTLGFLAAPGIVRSMIASCTARRPGGDAE